MDFKFSGKIEKGRLILDNPTEFQRYVRMFDNKKIQLILRKFKTSRTNEQNKLYWFYLDFIGKEIGEEAENLHSTFKAMFLADRTKKLPIVRSTTGLTTTEFTNFIEKIVRCVAEIGIVLPEPEKVDLAED